MPSTVGRDLLDVPFPDMVQNLAFAIARGQMALDRSSLATARTLARERVMLIPEIHEIIEPEFYDRDVVAADLLPVHRIDHRGEDVHLVEVDFELGVRVRRVVGGERVVGMGVRLLRVPRQLQDAKHVLVLVGRVELASDDFEAGPGADALDAADRSGEHAADAAKPAADRQRRMSET